jgi:hypothetical protein
MLRGVADGPRKGQGRQGGGLGLAEGDEAEVEKPLKGREVVMPNGGVPIHMILRPATGGWVVHCHGTEMRLIEETEWDASKRTLDPLSL